MPQHSARTQALAALGLPGTASPDDVTRAYRRLAKETHPDATGELGVDAGNRFRALSDAYRLLTAAGAGDASPEPAQQRARPQPPAPSPRPVTVGVRWTRPPIVAGPVLIVPSPRGQRPGPSAPSDL